MTIQKLKQDVIPDPVLVDVDTIQLPAATITVGGKQYVTSTLTMDFDASGAGGLDTGARAANTLYYLYVIIDSGVAKLIASVNSSLPTGFTYATNVGNVRTAVTTDDLTLPFVPSRFNGVWRKYNQSEVGTLTISTSSISSVENAWYRPFKDSDGEWFLDLNLYFVTAGNLTDFTFFIPGIAFDGFHAGSKTTNLDSAGTGVNLVSADPGGSGNGIRIRYPGSGENDQIIQGIYKLLTKPDWILFDPTLD